MTVPFLQYLLPDGKKKLIEISLSEELEQKAQDIIKSGFRFECEMLRTGDVSLTIFDIEKGEDVGIEIVPNGPEVPNAVERLIIKFKGKEDDVDDKK